MVVAIALGWYLGRRSTNRTLDELRKQHENELDSTLGAVWRSTQARCHILAERHAQKHPKEFRDALRNDLYRDILQLWRDQNDINLDRPDQAYNLAHEIMVLLDAKTVDDFMTQFANSYDKEKVWIEFHDKNHDDYISLVKFLNKSLDPKYETKWGW